MEDALHNTKTEKNEVLVLPREGFIITLLCITVVLVTMNTGEFREDLDVDALASFAFSLLEGGILLSKLDGDNKHMLTNITIFSSYLQQCCLKTR